jgi:hypothetical protein
MESSPEPGTPDGPLRAAAWECFYESVLEALVGWPVVRPIPGWEDGGNATVRAMQRGRRHTWLHARHVLQWSMFESIRISVRLAEAFAEWTRDGAPDVDALAIRLEQVERESRQAVSARAELRFVDQLLDAASGTELHLAEMDLALEAFRKADTPDRRAASS